MARPSRHSPERKLQVVLAVLRGEFTAAEAGLGVELRGLLSLRARCCGQQSMLLTLFLGLLSTMPLNSLVMPTPTHQTLPQAQQSTHCAALMTYLTIYRWGGRALCARWPQTQSCSRPTTLSRLARPRLSDPAIRGRGCVEPTTWRLD